MIVVVAVVAGCREEGTRDGLGNDVDSSRESMSEIVVERA